MPFWTMLAFAALSAPSPLEGVWETGCVPIGKGGRHGYVTRLTVAGKKVTVTSQLYARNDCDRPTILTEYSGELTRLTRRDGTIDFDHVVRDATMKVDAADALAMYNSGAPDHGCGMSGWQLGVARSVAGKTCAIFVMPALDATLYERAWIQGETLRVGSFPVEWSNTTPDKRPAAPGQLTFMRVTAPQ
jgi:hypothetical protein